MELQRITFFAFDERFRQIGEQLKDGDRFKSLLDSARRDVPLVDSFVDMTAGTARLPDGPTKDELFNRLMSIVHVLITLWSLSWPDDQDTSVPRAKPGDSPTDAAPLRLRRFGLN